MVLAYIIKHSFYKNEKIDLFISGTEGEVIITILNVLNNDKNNIEYEFNCSIFEQNTQKFSFAEGCNWNINHQIDLSGIDINPGLYAIKIKHQQSFEEYYLPFIIINNDNKNDILVIVNTNTWCAYNNWGGASFYTINKNDKNYADNIKNIYITNGAYDQYNNSGCCSFNRPYHSDLISNSIKQIIYNRNKPVSELGEHLLLGEKFLWYWLFDNNYKFDLITDIDVENIELLQDRKIIMFNCHAEYWSHKMYYNLLNVISNTSTNLINLSGNTIWRKVAINHEKNRIEKIGNPYCNEVLNWFDSNFSIDEFAKNNKITISPYLVLGVFFDNRGYGTYDDILCIDEKSWVFNNTGIKKGDKIGNLYDNAKPSGHETDKVYHEYIEEDDKKYLDNIKILGKGQNIDDGGGEIVIHNFKNAQVFSCGSISFTRCINDPQVTIMLKNVIEKFLD